jgi:hypothetical protein
VWRYLAMENACQAQLPAEAAGTTKPMSDAVARHTASQVGTLLAFQPYWDMIVSQEPDLLD